MNSLAEVVAACADALLTACAATMVIEGREPTTEGSRKIAMMVIDHVITRTREEGPKPD